MQLRARRVRVTVTGRHSLARRAGPTRLQPVRLGAEELEAVDAVAAVAGWQQDSCVTRLATGMRGGRTRPRWIRVPVRPASGRHNLTPEAPAARRQSAQAPAARCQSNSKLVFFISSFHADSEHAASKSQREARAASTGQHSQVSDIVESRLSESMAMSSDRAGLRVAARARDGASPRVSGKPARRRARAGRRSVPAGP